MSNAIADLLARAVDNVEADAGLAQRVMRRSRRRTRVYAVVSTLVVAAAAVSGTVALQGQSSDPAVVSVAPPTASPSAAPLLTVNGVSVTWVPKGFVANPVQRLGSKTEDQSVHGWFERRIDQVVGKTEFIGTELLDLGVRRNYTADLDQLARSAPSAKYVRVRGHRALLEQVSPQQPPASSIALLTWVEAPGVTLTVQAQGVSTAEAQQFAQRLSVGAATAPADPVSAEKSVRAAVTAAFTGGKPAALTLGAIENGERLAPVLAELTRTHPEVERTARVAMKSITFIDSAYAIAEVVINYQENGAQIYNTQANVVLVDGAWKVSQASYCDTAQLLVSSCPAS